MGTYLRSGSVRPRGGAGYIVQDAITFNGAMDINAAMSVDATLTMEDGRQILADPSSSAGYGFRGAATSGLGYTDAGALQLIRGGTVVQSITSAYNLALNVPFLINGTFVMQTLAQAITAVGNTLSASASVIELDPNASYTLTSTPSIAAGTYEGQYVEFHNVDSVFSVTIQDASVIASGCRTVGASAVIGPGDCVAFRYINSVWRQVIPVSSLTPA